MKQALVLVALSFVLGQCTNSANRLAQKDFNTWCEIATDFNFDQYEDNVSGLVTYSQKVSDSLRSPEVSSVYKSIQQVSNKDKIILIKKAAANVGLRNFDCPAFGKIYPAKHEQAVTESK